jgi:hypothetical protein
MLLLANMSQSELADRVRKAHMEDLSFAGLADSSAEVGTVGWGLRNGIALTRKAQAQARLLVDAQRHKPLIEAHICRLYEDPTIRGEILRHVSTVSNLQRKVTGRVAICYLQPPSRTIRGVDPARERAFFDAYRAAKTDRLCERWNRQAFFLSVVHVLPRFENGKFRWVSLTPDQCDVLFDVAEEDPSVLIYSSEAHGGQWIAVDSERWQWLDKSYNVLHEEEHGMGMVPWVTFRVQEAPAGDYWDRGSGSDLFEATIEVGRVHAHAKWVRQHNSKKLTTIAVGVNSIIPANQNLSSNHPVEASGSLDVQVLDTIVPIDGFLAELGAVSDDLLSSYGLVPEDGNPNNKAVNTEALIKLRNQQIKFFDDAEMEMAVRAAAVLRLHGVVSISEEEVRKYFKCRFVGMLDADSPQARVKTLQDKMAVGHDDPYAAYIAENPGVSREEAREYVLEHVRNRAEFYSEWAKANMPADPADDVKIAAQINGKAGGQISGEVRAQAAVEKQEEEPSNVST